MILLSLERIIGRIISIIGKDYRALYTVIIST